MEDQKDVSLKDVDKAKESAGGIGGGQGQKDGKKAQEEAGKVADAGMPASDKAERAPAK